MTWMNLPEEYRKGKFAILPIEYEKDVTYGQGASLGSKEIIKASKHLEYYDDQFDCEPFLKGIKLLEPLSLLNVSPEEMVEKVAEKVQQQGDKFLISLGGDHAVTIGIVKGLEEIHDDFSVIQFDAHADFRDGWNNSSLNHACVAKQISKNHSMALIGIRSMDSDEKRDIENHDNVHMIKSYELDKDIFHETMEKLKDKVYITIDVDVFDPSFLRNTGTPEPGGIFWEQMVGMLKGIFKEKEVIGADIVEFAPKVNYEAEAHALAKLCYKIMSLHQKYQRSS
ncbi:MAG: agmatinase [Nanoarchaeota archaeon]|nr:agmatinase [Nanoarchaeota archaeon]|tara:strand:- start:358 stop:1203 length:846 start_codon:yes stop_codon:yes gene_type:complete